jgi:hypothetical protein
MTLGALAVAALAVASAASACAKNGATSSAAAPGQVSTVTPVAPSGLSFQASLDAPLSSQLASVGDGITASLDEPLRALDGSVVAPKGAKLRGRVVDLGREGVQHLALQFDTLEVNGRQHPIRVRIIRIESARVVAADVLNPDSVAVDVYPPMPRTLEGREMGGGPSPEGLPLELPAGAGIRLFLARPFEPSRVGATSM